MCPKSKLRWQKTKFSSNTYKEIQVGSGAKSYMRKGFLIYEAMRKFSPIWGGCLSYMTLHPIPLNFLLYEENFSFFFISVQLHYILWGRGDRGFWICNVASLVMYCIDAPQRNVTKSLYMTTLPFLHIFNVYSTMQVMQHPHGVLLQGHRILRQRGRGLGGGSHRRPDGCPGYRHWGSRLWGQPTREVRQHLGEESSWRRREVGSQNQWPQTADFMFHWFHPFSLANSSLLHPCYWAVAAAQSNDCYTEGALSYFSTFAETGISHQRKIASWHMAV